jgi:hypothetical protein
LSAVALSDQNDNWHYLWCSLSFSSAKVYRHLMGQVQVHPAFRWLWSCSCQPKHKVFFWLCLQDRLSIRNVLKCRNMVLDSYTCENCILQREEMWYHLFLGCNFAKSCWQIIGIQASRTRSPFMAVVRLKAQLKIPFYMEIIILMIWSIWKVRNGWIFENVPPTI